MFNQVHSLMCLVNSLGQPDWLAVEHSDVIIDGLGDYGRTCISNLHFLMVFG